MPAKSFLSLTQSYCFAVGGSRVMKETGCNAKLNGNGTEMERNDSER